MVGWPIPVLSADSILQENRQITSRRVARSLLTILVVSVFTLRHVDVRAQISSVWIPATVEADAATNVFVQWDGLYPLAGLTIDLDQHVDLDRTIFTCSDQAAAIYREDETTYRILAPDDIRGNCSILLTLRPGMLDGESSIGIEPVLPDDRRWRNIELDKVVHTVAIRRVLTDGDNRVGTFSELFNEPVLLQTHQSLDIRKAFTVEFWMRTTDVGNVVLSSWDGRETTAYPAELIIEPAGRLVFFTGQQGLHESMSSPQPVADGRWHHVAVSNDRSRNVVTLNIDGSRVDSLRLADPSAARSGPLYLGGRSVASGKSDEFKYFRGQVDGVRVWNVARSDSEIARARYRTGIESSDVAATMEFDGEEQWIDGVDGLETSQSSLAFTRPMEDVNVHTQDRDVTLSWTVPVNDVTGFIIEESSDGHQFIEIGDVSVGNDEGVHPFSFTSYDVEGRVAYYRIRQVFADQSTRSSRVVKVGLGEMDDTPDVHFSNFPNPFSSSTRISYEVAEQARVSLSVWDIAGQAVARLVDEVQPTGIHEAEFDASELPSGIYFVRLEMGDLVLSRKVTVAR